MRMQLCIPLLATMLTACWGTTSHEVQPENVAVAARAKAARKFRTTTLMRPVFFGEVGEFIEDFNARMGGPFAASFWADERCSSTLIGPRVLLSAAHCFRSDTDVSIEFGGKWYDGTCNTAESFTARAVVVDVVLCRMKRDVPVPWFETISLDPELVKPRAKVMLTGFGGSEIAKIAPGTYLAGESTVATVAQGIAKTSGGAFLRDGDSGGAGFVSPTQGKRFLISVNSSVIKDERSSSVHLLSAARLFFDRWIKGDKVCGLDQQGLNCRS